MVQLHYVTLTKKNESKHQLCVHHMKTTNQSTLALMILHSRICSVVNKCRSLE